MNYRRLESILATTSSPPPSPSSALDAIGADNGRQQQPQPFGQPFRRSHTMRSSFTSLRSLKTRLKHPVAAAVSSGSGGGGKYSHLVGSPGSGRHRQHYHQNGQNISSSNINGQPIIGSNSSLTAKANVKAKLLKLRETYAEFRRLQSSSHSSLSSQHKSKDATPNSKPGSANFKVPENMPPKAAALLLEGAGGTGSKSIRRVQSLRITSSSTGPPDVSKTYGATIGARDVVNRNLHQQQPVLMVRKVNRQSRGGTDDALAVSVESLNDADDPGSNGPTRTATIRKSSVWANSSSKISLPDLVSRSFADVELPGCRDVICPSRRTSSGASNRHQESFKSRSSGKSQAGSTPDVGAIESGAPPPLSPTPSVLTAPFLTYENERLSPTLNRMTSASSPNLSTSAGGLRTTIRNKMDFLLPHQQHPAGSQPQTASQAAPSKHRQYSPKIVKKTRHLSTSSADGDSGSTSERRHLSSPTKLLNQRVGSLIETNNNNTNKGDLYNQGSANGTHSIDALVLAAGPGGIGKIGSSSDGLSPVAAPVHQPGPYWKQKIIKRHHKSQAQAQLDKLTQINIHLHALFAAVEHGHLEKARTILESTDVDVNSLNSDGISPLDVAVLSNNRSMTKMLLQQGAVENAHTIQAANNNVGLHLNNLLCEAENTIHELGNFDAGSGGQQQQQSGERGQGTGSGPGVASTGKTSFSNIIGKFSGCCFFLFVLESPSSALTDIPWEVLALSGSI
ncbi:uncharacterized protein LOC129738122 [Uranotaenia lowii]|uniref:uncharacterized protein LOC129738122 n=1 Tax=Uranotaenia lowii TaxID=190385 RepID=UPI002478E894|nr:uncharacterized protein LOC129738122 [Uranotaenia lowii]